MIAGEMTARNAGHHTAVIQVYDRTVLTHIPVFRNRYVKSYINSDRSFPPRRLASACLQTLCGAFSTFWNRRQNAGSTPCSYIYELSRCCSYIHCVPDRPSCCSSRRCRCVCGKSFVSAHGILPFGHSNPPSESIGSCNRHSSRSPVAQQPADAKFVIVLVNEAIFLQSILFAKNATAFLEKVSLSLPPQVPYRSGDFFINSISFGASAFA